MGRIKFCKRWEEEDAGLSGLEVTKRILEGTMGGLEEYLTFTMETEEDFQNTRQVAEGRKDGWKRTGEGSRNRNEICVICGTKQGR